VKDTNPRETERFVRATNEWPQVEKPRGHGNVALKEIDLRLGPSETSQPRRDAWIETNNSSRPGKD
jgi:hypothetical protein